MAAGALLPMSVDGGGEHATGPAKSGPGLGLRCKCFRTRCGLGGCNP